MENAAPPPTTPSTRDHDDAPPPAKRINTGRGSASSASAPSAAAQASPDADFSSSVRTKLKASNRTGQACDRCKIRKIRCDSTPGGCSPCRQAQTNCRTTDRITGKATTRGHSDRLEDENRYLREKLREYHQRLGSTGVQLEDINQVLGVFPTSNGVAQAPLALQNDPSVGPSSRPFGHTTGESGIFPIISRPPRSCFNPSLSILRGTKLSLFGMQIDTSEFWDDAGDEESPKSFAGLLEVLFGKETHGPAGLPEDLDQAMQYAGWFFKIINPFRPVVHKPEMVALLKRVYQDPQAFPNLPPSEKVLLHLMFSSIRHQIGQRNGNAGMLEEALKGFKFACGLLPELLKGETIKDLQALTALAIEARDFQKPQAAWFVTHFAVARALELGLNRSANSLPEDERRNLSNLDIEMRKRTFWTLNGLIVNLGGKLGRPLPLGMQDIDIEFPDPVPDCLPEEEGSPAADVCSFRVGIWIHKLMALLGQLYTTIYPVRGNPRNYAADVARLEEECSFLRKEIPPEFLDANAVEEQAKVSALFIEFFDLEFQFHLRHPVIYRQYNPDYSAQNLTVCLDICSRFLHVVDALLELKCLDVPWINVTLFLTVLFTALFVQDQRKNVITTEELRKLEADMKKWDNIIGGVGLLIGSGPRLQNSVQKIIDRSLRSLRQHVQVRQARAVETAAKEAARAVSNTPAQDGQDVQQPASTHRPDVKFTPQPPPPDIPHTPQQQQPTPYPQQPPFPSYPDPEVESAATGYPQTAITPSSYANATPTAPMYGPSGASSASGTTGPVGQQSTASSEPGVAPAMTSTTAAGAYSIYPGTTADGTTPDNGPYYSTPSVTAVAAAAAAAAAASAAASRAEAASTPAPHPAPHLPAPPAPVPTPGSVPAAPHQLPPHHAGDVGVAAGGSLDWMRWGQGAFSDAGPADDVPAPEEGSGTADAYALLTLRAGAEGVEWPMNFLEPGRRAG